MSARNIGGCRADVAESRRAVTAEPAVGACAPAEPPRRGSPLKSACFLPGKARSLARGPVLEGRLWQISLQGQRHRQASFIYSALSSLAGTGGHQCCPCPSACISRAPSPASSRGPNARSLLASAGSSGTAP
ncbi:unnamed protein product [Rangifer tarandus platyrhynchus]|uniref:Uncharacterized protein n=1 Tax=Rangifer tarandus platyrhynchus TaxID=3082113 RepID=A0ABN8Y2V0_RANTA|nr:unnamed protein product [Rangifer tarandus platyrhynchus]